MTTDSWLGHKFRFPFALQHMELWIDKDGSSIIESADAPLVLKLDLEKGESTRAAILLVAVVSSIIRQECLHLQTQCLT
jgi:hypothetical protein